MSGLRRRMRVFVHWTALRTTGAAMRTVPLARATLSHGHASKIASTVYLQKNARDYARAEWRTARYWTGSRSLPTASDAAHLPALQPATERKRNTSSHTHLQRAGGRGQEGLKRTTVVTGHAPRRDKVVGPRCKLPGRCATFSRTRLPGRRMATWPT